MKVPSSKEEFLVWPPMGASVGVVVGTTLFDVLETYLVVLQTHEGAYWFAGYVFPLIMGLSFAWRLHGKYWLGFAWLGFGVYLIALLLSWVNDLSIDSASMSANIFLVLVCFSLLLTVQASVLFCKRISIHKSDP